MSTTRAPAERITGNLFFDVVEDSALGALAVLVREAAAFMFAARRMRRPLAERLGR